MKQASASPTAAEMKAIEDKKDLDDWGKQGNVTPAFNDLEKHGGVVAYAQTSESNKQKNTIKNKVKAAAKGKVNKKSPTAAESKAKEDKKDLDDWGKQGNVTSAFHHADTEYVQTKAEVKTQTDKKERIASDQYPAIMKEQEKEKKDELVKPTAPADNNKDAEPK